MGAGRNQYKIVKLKREDGVDWKDIFNSILTHSKEKHTIAAASSFDFDSKTKDSIELYMCNQLESQGTQNNYNNALQAITTDVDSLLGGGLSALVKATSGAASVAKAVVAAAQSNEGGTDGTGVLWNPWYQNISSWNGLNGGIKFNYSFEFALGQYGIWDALEEVYKPVVNLVSTAMPHSIGAVTSSGPYPTALMLVEKAFKAMKRSADDLSITDLETLGTTLEEIVLSSYKDYTYKADFGGYISFNHMMIKNTSYEFSTETDTRGYPIWGKVTLEFEGAIPMALSYENKSTVAFGLRSAKR